MTDTFEQACREADKKKRKAAEQAAENAKPNGNGAKRVLLVDPGELPTVAEKLRDILATSGMLFDRGVPVRIIADAGLPVAVPLTNHSVVRMTHQHCRPQKNGENATLPDRVASLYLDMIGDWNLPKLIGITSSPPLTADGSVRAAVGYDRDASLYCYNIPKLSLPDKPTKEHAQKALAVLRQQFRTFPFADAVRKLDHTLGVDVVDLTAPIGMDESSFLAGLLTAVCRQSLWLAPGFLLNAPQISGAGSGKGLLARAICVIAYAVQPRPFPPGNDRNEMDKRIVAELIEGRPVIFMDNVNATLLRSNTLASVITERPSGVRELGRSRMIKLEHASLVVLTGNGLAVGEDLARRFIFCQLDPRLEDPEARPFEPGFLNEIEERRADLLTAALTIWRWGRQNKPKAGIPLGSFETWGQWVRDPLLALGCQDPVSQIKEIKARDPKRQKVAEIYELWWEHHAGVPTRASEIAEEVRAAVDPQGRGRQYVAKAIEDLTGTRQSGFVLTRQKGEGRKAVATYALTKTAPPGDSAQRHPPHTPHPPNGDKTSSKSTAPENEAGGDAQSMPRGMPDADAGHSQGIPQRGDSRDEANPRASGEPQGMGGMGGMPPVTAGFENPADRRGCDFCGKPADHQPLRQVCDGSRTAWLHRRCEVPWLHGQPGPEQTTVYEAAGSLSNQS